MTDNQEEHIHNLNTVVDSLHHELADIQEYFDNNVSSFIYKQFIGAYHATVFVDIHSNLQYTSVVVKLTTQELLTVYEASKTIQHTVPVHVSTYFAAIKTYIEQCYHEYQNTITGLPIQG
jgi:hypothetical protein